MSSTEQRVWGVHIKSPEFDPLEAGGVGINYDFIKDLTSFPSKDDLKAAYEKAFPDKTVNSRAQSVGALHRFSREIKTGDVIVCLDKGAKTISLGTVSGPYRFLGSEAVYPHFLPVAWEQTRIPRANFSPSTLKTLSSLMAVFEVKAAAGQETLDTLQGVTRPAVMDWVPFYEELADIVLGFRNDRQALLDKISECAVASGVPNLFDYLTPKHESHGADGRLADIDPFSVFGPFNRSMTLPNRLRIAAAFREVFGVQAPAPTGFDGVPLVNNMRSWFIHFPEGDTPGDVEQLWDLAEAAVRYAGDSSEQHEEKFISAYDAARHGTTAMLTMGLFYLRPRVFIAFDSKTVHYLRDHYPEPSSLGLTNKLSGDEYMANLTAVRKWVKDDPEAPNSLPELSHLAFVTREKAPEPGDDDPSTPILGDAYDVAQIIEDGCFLPEASIEAMVRSLETKKNVILQGPPGTGKTWLARRLAWAFIGKREPDSLTIMQFHPSMSYEDFVRGYRPSTSGGLELVDGPFVDLAERARANPETRYVMLIEEINRGNPAQIFGEMLTLLEHTKRTPASAMQLIYPRDGEQFYLPPNLYIIGTMNLADRSLALVDIAFRRRFAFLDLSPEIGDQWLEYTTGLGYDRDVLTAFGAAMRGVNDTIADDPLLGRQYQVGHSYLVPRIRLGEGDGGADTASATRAWLRSVTDTEIVPLLTEYWFEQPDKVAEVAKTLKAAL